MLRDVRGGSVLGAMRAQSEEKESRYAHLVAVRLLPLLVNHLGEPCLMRTGPESDILANFFADVGEKMCRKCGESLRRFSSFNFQEKWPQEVSRNVFHEQHEPVNKILSPQNSGSWTAQHAPTLRGSTRVTCYNDTNAALEFPPLCI